MPSYFLLSISFIFVSKCAKCLDMKKHQKVRALSLLSGGLDSILAVKVLEEQGIEVTGITFTSPFFGSKNAEEAAKELKIPLIILDITREHLALVKDPPHGYGKCMNPCIDCHALMIKKAGQIKRRKKFDLIATGEVLGERPMSQNKQSLDVVARCSGYGKHLLRPLSAKLLAPTLPERQGKVNRERLLSIEGRSRKPQMALAKKYGIKKYVQPAGGCLLTDVNFSKRLKELLGHNPNATSEDVWLLKLGRHFRLKSGAKVIVGRDKKDNEGIMEHYRKGRVLIVSDIKPGPVALLIGSAKKEDINLAAKLCASFADHHNEEVDMQLKKSGKEARIKSRPSPRHVFKYMQI